METEMTCLLSSLMIIAAASSFSLYCSATCGCTYFKAVLPTEYIPDNTNTSNSGDPFVLSVNESGCSSFPLVWTLQYVIPTTTSVTWSLSNNLVADPDELTQYLIYSSSESSGFFNYSVNQIYLAFVNVTTTDLACSSSGSMSIWITQVYRVPTIWSTCPLTVTIGEDSLGSAYLTSLSVTDPQGALPLKYSFAGTKALLDGDEVGYYPSSVSQQFYISSSGVITTAPTCSFNASTVTDWVIYINIANSLVPALTNTYTLTVSVTATDHPPTFFSLQQLQYVYESETVGSTVYVLPISDSKSGTTQSTLDSYTGFSVYCSSTPSSGCSTSPSFNVSTGGAITTLTTFNQSVIPQYILTIFVWDSTLSLSPETTISTCITIVVEKGTFTQTTQTTTTSSSGISATTLAWVIPVSILGGLGLVAGIGAAIYCNMKGPNSVSSSQPQQPPSNSYYGMQNRTPPPPYQNLNDVHIYDPHTIRGFKWVS